MRATERARNEVLVATKSQQAKAVAERQGARTASRLRPLREGDEAGTKRSPSRTPRKTSGVVKGRTGARAKTTGSKALRAGSRLRKDEDDKATQRYEAMPQGERKTRKSTRGGENRVKPDSQLKRRQTRATRAPKSRAAQSAAKAKGSGRRSPRTSG
jgi:hypothetical protein